MTMTRLLPYVRQRLQQPSALASSLSPLSSLLAPTKQQQQRRTITRTTSAWEPAKLDSLSTEQIANQCHLNVVYSPFPPIKSGPYPSLYEFASSNWAPHGGFLSDKVAIRDCSTGLQRTFSDYHQTTGNLAAALQKDFGLNPLDGSSDHHHCVAIYCPNHVDYLPMALAVSLTGAKVTPINPLYTATELETVLRRSRSSVLFVHHSKLDESILDTVHHRSNIKHIIVITDDEGKAEDLPSNLPVGTVALNSLRHSYNEHAFYETVKDLHHGGHTLEYRHQKQNHPHPLLLPYSSGTTGLPKGVCLTHDNLVANLLQFEEVESLVFPVDQAVISPLPFFHIYAFTVSLLYSAWKGNTLYTMSGRFDLEEFCKHIQEFKPARAHLVPPIVLGLTRHPVVDKYNLSSLRMIVSAAAPLSADMEIELEKRIGVPVKQAWGMSELSPLATINSDFNVKHGTVGPLAPSTMGKIVDPATGKSLPAHTSGELLVKGPQVMLGYLDDPEKTAECLSDSGWLRTGDVAHYDEDGFFYITDRIKELIKVRGYQVAPAELEALLLTHPSINDAAVIPVSHPEHGEVPRAYVVLAKGYEKSASQEKEIYEWVKERVAPFKRLDGGVVFIDVVPKSASGKILRRILRDQVKAETEAAAAGK